MARFRFGVSPKTPESVFKRYSAVDLVTLLVALEREDDPALTAAPIVNKYAELVGGKMYDDYAYPKQILGSEAKSGVRREVARRADADDPEVCRLLREAGYEEVGE